METIKKPEEVKIIQIITKLDRDILGLGDDNLVYKYDEGLHIWRLWD